MEGNECYKLTTIRNYVEKTGAPPIRTAVDVGCHVGEIAALIRFYFPQSQVFGFEPVEEYYREACRRMLGDASVKLFQAAVCGLHRFGDDLGVTPRSLPARMKLAKGREGAGPGWRGGSVLIPEEHAWPDTARYVPTSVPVHCLTFDELAAAIAILTGRDEVDYVKMDCEGCECDALGCASVATLQRIRFISGEYHDVSRFYKVMSQKLYQTHYVNLVGEGWGSFFCERIDGLPTILEKSRVTREVRTWSPKVAVDWHPFRGEFVLPHERLAHGLACS